MMGGYLRRFFLGHLLIVMIIVGSILVFGKSRLMPIFLFGGLMELLFYYLDSKYLPKKRAELMRALVETFQAKPFSEGVVKFKIKTIDLFARIELDFPDLYLANVETIGFHIPRNQVDRLSEKPVSELKEDKIDGIETYRFYETIESELKLAKENLEKMIEGEDIVTPKNTT